MSPPSKTIALATIGSLGDLHPILALGRGLKEAGHRVIVAADPYYATHIEEAGLEHHPMRPVFDPNEAQELAKAMMNNRQGPQTVVQQFVGPSIGDTMDDLGALLPKADLLISTTLILGAPLLHRKLGIPWASVILQPMSFLSPYDPPILPEDTTFGAWHPLEPLNRWIHTGLFAAGKWLSRRWCRPWDDIRKALGYEDFGHPMFQGGYSPDLHLALFSPLWGLPQHDWPASTVQTGFCFYDGSAKTPTTEEAQGLERLNQFLKRGEPPIVVTLGSAAVWSGASVYQTAANALGQTFSEGCRVVYLVGNNPENIPTMPPHQEALILPYAPYSLLFPRARFIIHQGGIGTSSQAVRAGVPQIIIPFSHDQPDNAHRLQRLGVAIPVARQTLSDAKLSQAIQTLLQTPAMAQRAHELADEMADENGVDTAVNAIHRVFFRESVR